MKISKEWSNYYCIETTFTCYECGDNFPTSELYTDHYDAYCKECYRLEYGISV